MPRTRIKICGVKDVDTALAAVDAGANWVGLVFVDQSPRYVTVEQAKAVVSALPAEATPVGLFADHNADEINRIAGELGLETVQLHGREPIRILDKLDGLKIFRAISVGGTGLAKAVPWDSDPRVWALLLDSPPTGGLLGGSGIKFDWERIDATGIRFYKPFFLAGGLTPDNVGEAIRTVRPYAVDVSSGVESSRGVKDVGLIKAFCEAVRDADSHCDHQ